jgi:hypothetical protein
LILYTEKIAYIIIRNKKRFLRWQNSQPWPLHIDICSKSEWKCNGYLMSVWGPHFMIRLMVVKLELQLVDLISFPTNMCLKTLGHLRRWKFLTQNSAIY